MKFEVFKQHCKYSGFCNISCSHPSRDQPLPPLFSLCNEKQCPVCKNDANTEDKSEVDNEDL